jgi:hypothetical protein
LIHRNQPIGCITVGTSTYGRRTCLIQVSDLNLLQRYIARVPGVTGMKAHIHYFAIWFPLIVLLFLVLSFIALTMIAQPGARLPPLSHNVPALSGTAP